MADEEHHDTTFESADAGASLTYPQQAGRALRCHPVPSLTGNALK